MPNIPKKTLLITGSSGLLGHTACTYFSNKYRVIGLSRADLTLSDADATQAYILTVKPDIILHCAANTQVEVCETAPALAYLDNVTTTENISHASEKVGATMVFISSTGVYGNGQSTPYTETCIAQPTTVYHRTKLQAETCVQQICSKWLIIRTGWLFTRNTETKKNFINNRYLEALSVERLLSDVEQMGNPTYDQDLVACIDALLEKGVRGIYNCVNQEAASRYDYVKAIVDGFGLRTPVIKVLHSSFNRKAPVPLNESAMNQRLKNEGILLRPWKEALFEAIECIKKNKGV